MPKKLTAETDRNKAAAKALRAFAARIENGEIDLVEISRSRDLHEATSWSDIGATFVPGAERLTIKFHRVSKSIGHTSLSDSADKPAPKLRAKAKRRR